ncbi:rNA polymerase sigma factor sigma-70 family [Clostridium sp. CAG:571]|jgi:RNA polymerase sigma factor (sigma-70 family)|nr:rNA polymerase sigma factor sigma-70 family [Clostridium sp. CAG:571]HJJ06826.1 sigma-70 family RNA polymerase sigma factor [Clostridiaceae bacterium]
MENLKSKNAELGRIFKEFKENDMSSYDFFYKEYYSLIYGIVFSILKNKENSEDVVQNVLIKIFSLDKSKFPDRGSLSWLYTVSKNEALNYLRKNKQFVNIEEIYEIKEETDEIEKIIDVHTYNKIINGLNEKEKEIVSLKILSNFTFKKIGQLLKMPTATVQWKYYKAVDSLKISLGNLAMFMITFIVLVVKNKILTNKDSNSIQENNQIEINEKESNVRENESLKATSSAETFECIVPAESSESSIEIDKEENITDGVLISFCGIFLMFFIIFSIFFKNRQQKRRKKRLNNVNIKK